jgi:hypothetical protein
MADDIDNNESARELSATPREVQGDCQGAVMFDASCRIAHVTPAAEKFLGWRNDDVVGAHCQSIFDCRDTLGDSLCARCGLKLSLERGEDIPGMLARVKDCHAQWHAVNTTFLYLNLGPYGLEPRVIGVFHGLGSLPHQLPYRHPAGSKAVKWPAP